MPKKDSLKRSAKQGARTVGSLMNGETHPDRLRKLKFAYAKFKNIEEGLDYMEEEIHTYHIRNSEFPGDLMGRPDDDFDD